MPLDLRLILTILFFLFLTVFVLTHKKGRQMHVWKSVPIFYAVMYRTKLGLNFMDKVAKKYFSIVGRIVAAIIISFSVMLLFILPEKGFLVGMIIKISVLAAGVAGILILIKPSYLNQVMVYSGFYGMALIVVLLVQNLIPLFTKPEAPSGAGLVLPIKGAGIFEGVIFFVPIEFWILSIFIIALVHEYAHGIMARKHNIPVKSSGFAFLGIAVPIVPAAFVEPDEKKLQKKPIHQQLGVFSAGPFANIVLAAFLVVLSLLVIGPLVSGIIQPDGIEITDFAPGDFPAKQSGIQVGEVIKEVDNVATPYVHNLSYEFNSKNPGDTVNLKTNKGTYEFELTKDPENETRAYMGIYLKQSVTPRGIFWLMELVNFLIILNLGIGLFNLLPVGPLDGGRMLLTVLLRRYDKKVAFRIFAKVSMFLLFIVILNITIPIFRNIVGVLG
jgi:hypothetical protein